MDESGGGATTDEEKTLCSSKHYEQRRNYHSTNTAFAVDDTHYLHHHPPHHQHHHFHHMAAATKIDFEAATLSLLRKGYDPHDFGNTDNPTSFWGTVFHLAIISFGPATLTLPKSFHAAGYVVAFVVTLAIVYLYAYNMHTLVCSEYELCKLRRVPNMTYADTLHVAVVEGPERLRGLADYCRLLIYVVFIVEWMGCTSLTVVLLSENLQTVYRHRYNGELDLRTIMLALLAPMLLLASIRKLNYLVPFSVAATAINAFCMLVVVYYVAVEPWPAPVSSGFGSLGNVPLVAGAVLFNLSAAGIIMPLKNEMKDPRRFGNGLGSVLVVSYVPVSACYALFGLLCSLKYGDRLLPSVIQNLPGHQLLGQSTVALSTLTMAFIFPLPVYIVVDVVWNDILRRRRDTLRWRLAWELALRAAIVIASFLAAYSVPNISLFLSFSGTVCTSIDGIIVPAVIEVLVAWRVSPAGAKFAHTACKNAAIVCVGCVLIVTGTMTCVRDVVDYYSK